MTNVYLTQISDDAIKQFIMSKYPNSTVQIGRFEGYRTICRDVVVLDQKGNYLTMFCLGPFGVHSKDSENIYISRSPFNKDSSNFDDFSFLYFMLENLDGSVREIYLQDYIDHHLNQIKSFFSNLTCLESEKVIEIAEQKAKELQDLCSSLHI